MTQSCLYRDNCATCTEGLVFKICGPGSKSQCTLHLIVKKHSILGKDLEQSVFTDNLTHEIWTRKCESCACAVLWGWLANRESTRRYVLSLCVCLVASRVKKPHFWYARVKITCLIFHSTRPVHSKTHQPWLLFTLLNILHLVKNRYFRVREWAESTTATLYKKVLYLSWRLPCV